MKGILKKSIFISFFGPCCNLKYYTKINKFEITLNTTFIDLIVLEVKRGTKVSRREILLFYFYTSTLYAKYLFKTNIKKKVHKYNWSKHMQLI